MKLLSFFIFAVMLNLGSYACVDNKTSSYKKKDLKIYLHPDLKKYGPFSHVCKMGDANNYYAVLGTYFGTVFVNYTDQNLEEGDIRFFRGAPSRWRECRSYKHPNGNTYVYVVTEGPDFTQFPGGIQIFKLNKDSVELVNTYLGSFNRSHTIAIDTNKGLAFVNGSRWHGAIPDEHQSHKDHLGGLRILDIQTDPENPRDIGYFNTTYTHDSYVLGEVDLPSRQEFAEGKNVEIKARKAYVVYLADIFKGSIHVLDALDPSKPVLLNSVFTPLYNQGIATHNVWASEDKKWLFATEETDGSSLLVYDIKDPSKPRFVTAYRSENVADNSVIHNVVIKGNIAYCSWYKEGLRLIDVSNPVHPKEIAFFDSSSADFKDSFHGNWSVDIDDRDRIIISDIEEGLFVLSHFK